MPTTVTPVTVLRAPTAAVAATASGSVRGRLDDGIYSFKGVPYAAPPFGANRLAPPRRVESWSGVRDATEWGAKPPQLPYPEPFDTLLDEPGLIGEDCLNLNVWTPALGAAALPVMVFIPGGQFEHGTGAAYDGSHFARDGVVCVTINYRVGADGFLCFGDGNANRAMLDQIAALEWVRDNIAAFGGDRRNVTVFGQSAGAICAAMLLAMPAAEGLFRRAILQSGGAHPAMSSATAEKVARWLAGKLGVAPTRDALANVPIDGFLRAQAELLGDLAAGRDPQGCGSDVMASMMPWQPVIDGATIPERPIDRISAGCAANVDLIVGSATEEFRFFLVPNGMLAAMTDEMLDAAIEGFGMPLEATRAKYRAAHQGASPGDLLAAVKTDWYFGDPARRLAAAHAKSATTGATWAYEFAWRSPQFGGRLGACHGLDLPFVFDAFGEPMEALCGVDPPRSLVEAMHGAWVAFARTGDCGWPKYDPVEQARMRFDATSVVVRG